jgi:hypothetical protein
VKIAKGWLIEIVELESQLGHTLIHLGHERSLTMSEIRRFADSSRAEVEGADFSAFSGSVRPES